MTQNGQYVKRGVLTSRDLLESHLQIRSNDQTQPPTFSKPALAGPVQGTSQATANIVIKPPMTTEELNQTKYFNSLGVRNGRPEYTYAYHQTVNNSNFVPPPPSRFLVASGHHSSSGPQPSQLPINSSHPITIVQGQPQQLFQSVHKTFIPYHINNEIPVLNSETKYYHQQQQSHQENVVEEDDEMNGADVRMLQEYDKLYQKYQEERETNVALLRKVEILQGELAKAERDDRSEEQVNPPPAEPIIKQIIKTKEVYVTKPTKVDTRQLISIIMRKVKPVMDQTFERRKTACLNKMKALLSDQEALIKTAVLRSTEELIRR